jgi:hypothetical protein
MHDHAGSLSTQGCRLTEAARSRDLACAPHCRRSPCTCCKAAGQCNSVGSGVVEKGAVDASIEASSRYSIFASMSISLVEQLLAPIHAGGVLSSAPMAMVQVGSVHGWQ